MTYAPKTIVDLQHFMRGKTGLPWVSLGIIGSASHKRAGTSYHLGKDDLKMYKRPYSVYESPRDLAGLSDAASALDVGYFSGSGFDLREMSLWIVAECEAGAPDTLDIREIIYSPDGETVLRWDREGERDSGDDSHESHTHFSWHRDAEHRDKIGVFKRYFDGGDATPAKPSVPSADWTERLMMTLPTVKRDMRGRDVGRVQGLLHANGYDSSAIDNIFGPKTERDVKNFQESHTTRNSVSNGTGDGIVGRYTWTDLLGE